MGGRLHLVARKCTQALHEPLPVSSRYLVACQLVLCFLHRTIELLSSSEVCSSLKSCVCKSASYPAEDALRGIGRAGRTLQALLTEAASRRLRRGQRSAGQLSSRELAGPPTDDDRPFWASRSTSLSCSTPELTHFRSASTLIRSSMSTRADRSCASTLSSLMPD